MNALSIDEAALDVNNKKRRTGYDTKVKAKAAAVATIGEHARDGFEFEVFKVDGRWQWRAFDVVKPPTAADIKASGGKKAAKADAIAKAAADQARHEERGAERAKAEGRLRPGTSLATLAQAITDCTPVPELEIVIPKDDGLELPEFLKRPKQTEEEKEALRKKLAKTVGPERVIKNPPNVKQAKTKAKKRETDKHLSDENVKRAVQMLKRKDGARSSELQKELEWTGYHVRRAMRDVIRKKLSHKTKVTRDGRDTIYKIV